MWLFKKRRYEPPPSPISDAECREMRRKALQELANFKPTGLMSYWDIKERHRAQEGKKMKLEAGKWYKTREGVYQAEQYDADWIRINGWLYSANGDVRYNGTPPLMGEVPAPLRLEVGKLYALSDGSVEWCERVSHKGAYRLGLNHYWVSGNPTLSNPHAPRILHRIRLNEEPEPAPGQAFMDACERLGAAVGIAMAAPAYTDIRIPGVWPMPVTYRTVHHDDKPCTREIAIPEGYEDINRIPGSIEEDKNLLMAVDGFWVPYSLLRCPYLSPAIRPLKKPFRLSGPGWYKTRNGAWVKYRDIRSGDPRWDDKKLTFNFTTGRNMDGHEELDLIARATDAQARVLDGL